MEKRSDISKSIALVLIILTVIISATSTWILVTKTMSSSEPESSLNRALVHLRILKGPIYEPPQSDTNSGDVKLFITKNKGG